MTTVERLDAKVVSGASKDRCGPSNQQWNSVGDYVASQTATATLTATGARIPGGLVKNPDRLKHLVDPNAPTKYVGLAYPEYSCPPGQARKSRRTHFGTSEFSTTDDTWLLRLNRI
jgi:hypothetical protein